MPSAVTFPGSDPSAVGWSASSDVQGHAPVHLRLLPRPSVAVYGSWGVVKDVGVQGHALVRHLTLTIRPQNRAEPGNVMADGHHTRFHQKGRPDLEQNVTQFE